MKFFRVFAVILSLAATCCLSAGLQLEGLVETLRHFENDGAMSAYELIRQSSDHDRLKRGVADDIKSKFKDFSEKIGNMPDQLGDSLKKYMEERGISLESIQNILKQIWEAMQKLVEEVQKAIN